MEQVCAVCWFSVVNYYCGMFLSWQVLNIQKSIILSDNYCSNDTPKYIKIL